VTAQTAPYSTDDPPPREGPRVAPGRAGSRSPWRCARCGAVGTHYLTCPGLRLPPGYRLSEARRPGAPSASGQAARDGQAGWAGETARAGETGPGPRPVAGRPGGGPDHPDWPRPPRQ